MCWSTEKQGAVCTRIRDSVVVIYRCVCDVRCRILIILRVSLHLHIIWGKLYMSYYHKFLLSVLFKCFACCNSEGRCISQKKIKFVAKCYYRFLDFRLQNSATCDLFHLVSFTW
jgi:hypothetical protein